MIFLTKIIIWLKEVLAAFFVLIFRATKPLLKLIFYKTLVPLYRLYFSLSKKIQTFKLADTSLWQILSVRASHAAVIILTVLIVIFNITTNTRAGSLNETAGKTVLSKLVSSEFGAINEEQLIEETYNDRLAVVSNNDSLSQATALRVQPQIAPESEFVNEGSVLINREGTALVQRGSASTKDIQLGGKIIVPKRNEIVEYIVQIGDTVSSIAEKFGLSVNTILWENNLSAFSLIRPGDKLIILPTSGLSHLVAKGDTIAKISSRYNVEEEKIITVNKLSGGQGLIAGQKIIIPGGRKTGYAQREVQKVAGYEIIKDIITKPKSAISKGNKMAWPTSGYRITQYYSWRHHAVDIADKVGTPIYASDAGVVEFSGWSRGYGNNIVINHGGGKKTRYAHLSKFYATRGDEVNKGEAIAAMGNTGWSTGPHLHFEIMIGNIKYNPLNYIK